MRRLSWMSLGIAIGVGSTLYTQRRAAELREIMTPQGMLQLASTAVGTLRSLAAQAEQARATRAPAPRSPHVSLTTTDQ